MLNDEEQRRKRSVT